MTGNLLKNKIDFVAILSASNCNPNGDPLTGNRPRVSTATGRGLITNVCVKRKLRNRMQDMGYDIFVQSEDRATDGCNSLSQRASKALGNIRDREVYANSACELWLDVRTFGQVFAFSDNKGLSVSVRGPVTVSMASSVSPVEVESIQITKSVNGENKGKDETRASDTMGMTHVVTGVYIVTGSINVQQAERVGFTTDDAEVLKKCLATLFVNDESSARPSGSCVVERLYWFEHNCREGQYSPAKVHRSIHVVPRDPDTIPRTFDDYEVLQDELPGLKCEIIEGA